MVRVLIGILICLCFVVEGNGQKSFDVFTIRNFNQSLAVSIDQHTVLRLSLSDHGAINEITNKEVVTGHYMFQGQEYEPELGLYLFPKRFYSPKDTRFYQPDPKSQYYSPYLFGAGDPINMVDLDGMKGIPLILYGEDDFSEVLDKAVANFKAEVPNAHYRPLSSLVNGEIGDLPEWNGNVFLLSHMGLDEGKEVMVERSKDPLKLKSNVRGKKTIAKASYDMEDDVYEVGVDARKLGRELRNLADAKDVKLSNVFAGGCQGSAAADRIAEGVTEIPSANGRSWLTVAGLKEGYYSSVAGKATGGEDAKGAVLYHKDRVDHVGTAEGRQLNEMAEGRIPSNQGKLFKIVSKEY